MYYDVDELRNLNGCKSPLFDETLNSIDTAPQLPSLVQVAFCRTFFSAPANLLTIST